MSSPGVRQCKMIKEPGDDVPDEILEEILGCNFSQIALSPENRLRLASPSGLESDLIAMSPDHTLDGNTDADTDVKHMREIQKLVIKKQRGMIKDIQTLDRHIRNVDHAQDLANQRAMEALILARRYGDVSQGQSKLEGSVATQLEVIKALDSRFQKELSLASTVNEARMDLFNDLLDKQFHGLTGLLRIHVETVYDGMGKLETKMTMREEAAFTRVYKFGALILALLVVVAAIQVKLFWF
ncbi:hypothetical protein CGCSCA5_v009953 [Colletotrichum siamense]|nr:hypothetical protein CGCSCA5_v009953 [Colletotrichum siamense]